MHKIIENGKVIGECPGDLEPVGELTQETYKIHLEGEGREYKGPAIRFTQRLKCTVDPSHVVEYHPGGNAL